MSKCFMMVLYGWHGDKDTSSNSLAVPMPNGSPKLLNSGLAALKSPGHIKNADSQFQSDC